MPYASRRIFFHGAVLYHTRLPGQGNLLVLSPRPVVERIAELRARIGGRRGARHPPLQGVAEPWGSQGLVDMRWSLAGYSHVRIKRL